MSTRCTTHFVHEGETTPSAIIYRHSDGYPEGAGKDIHKFLNECSRLKDNRFSVPNYLAAKYVVFLADMFNRTYDLKLGHYIKPASKLEFLSVGVMMEDPGDIDYRYIIECNDKGRPKVTCLTADGVETPIPGY